MPYRNVLANGLMTYKQTEVTLKKGVKRIVSQPFFTSKGLTVLCPLFQRYIYGEGAWKGKYFDGAKEASKPCPAMRKKAKMTEAIGMIQ